MRRFGYLLLALILPALFWAGPVEAKYKKINGIPEPLHYATEGRKARQRGDLDGSIRNYSKAIRLKPDYYKAYNGRGIAWRRKGNYARAIADYTAAIRLDPKYVVAYYNRGVAYRLNKEYDQAIQDFSQAIKLDPKYTLAYNGRGIAWRKKGLHARAIADYTQAIELNPKYGNAYANRAVAWRMRGRYKEVIADSTRALEVDPKNDYTHYDRALAYEKTGRLKAALRDAREYVKRSPKNRDGPKLVARLERQLNAQTTRETTTTTARVTTTTSPRATTTSRPPPTTTLRLPPPRPDQTRIALVIGNANYESAPLKNPVRDARAVSRALRKVGFQVVEHHDLDQNRMKRAIIDFGDRLRAAQDTSRTIGRRSSPDGRNVVGLFYYAGHGAQVRGYNYLIPIGARINSERHVDVEAVRLASVMAELDAARNGLNLVILDACRNNPFGRSYRSAAQGLASVTSPVGTLIAFATAPGRVASDGTGRNGLYTQALVRHLKTPGLRIEDVFKRVRRQVRKASKGLQIPWESSSLEGDFYFRR